MKFIGHGEAGSGYPARRRKEQPAQAVDLPPEQELSLVELTGEAERIAANLEKTGHYLARTVMRELARRLQVPQAPDARSVEPEVNIDIVANALAESMAFTLWENRNESSRDYWRKHARKAVAAVKDATLARSADGLSREAQVAWPEQFASLVAQLEESAKTYGYWNTLRDTDEATIEYWRNRTADLRARVLAAIAANAEAQP